MSEEPPAQPPSRESVRQRWQERLNRFATSGLTVAAFCLSEGLPVKSFYNWKRRLSASAATVSPPDRPRLLSVSVLPASSSSPVEVVLSSGRTLRVPSGCDLAFVRSLVAALEDPSC